MNNYGDLDQSIDRWIEEVRNNWARQEIGRVCWVWEKRNPS